MANNSVYSNEVILEAFIRQLNNCKMILEASDNMKNKVTAAQNKAKDNVKKIDNPKKVNAFLKNNKEKYEKALDELNKKDPKKASLLKKAWNFLTYAVGKGVKFILSHWDSILKLMMIIAIAWVSITAFAWLCWPIKKFFETCGKNGAAIEQMTKSLPNNAQKASAIAANMGMLGGGLR